MRDVLSESGVVRSTCWSCGKVLKRDATYMKTILSSGLDMQMSVTENVVMAIKLYRYTDDQMH